MVLPEVASHDKQLTVFADVCQRSCARLPGLSADCRQQQKWQSERPEDRVPTLTALQNPPIQRCCSTNEPRSDLARREDGDGLSQFLSTIVPRFGIIRAARRALPRIQLPQFHRSRCLRTRVRQTCEIVTGRTRLSVRCARLFCGLVRCAWTCVAVLCTLLTTYIREITWFRHRPR